MWHWSASSKIFNSTSNSSLKSFSIISSKVPHLFFPNNNTSRSAPKTESSPVQRYQIWSLKLFSPVIPLQPRIRPQLACVSWKTVLTFLLVFPESGWPQGDFFGSHEGISLSCQTNYSSSQRKTQQFWHSTQHQVCFHIISLLALPGRTGLHNGGQPFTRSYSHWSAGWKGPMEVSKSNLRHLELNCLHRSAVAMLNPSRLCSVLSWCKSLCY